MKYPLLIMLIGFTPVLFADSKLVSAHQACAKVKNNTERLACFDAITLPQVIPPVKQAQKEFGIKEKAKPKEQITSLTATVAKVKKSSRSGLTITLDNGQVWKQIGDTRFKLNSGDRIKIETGAFGSFKLRRVDGNKSIKVKRKK